MQLWRWACLGDDVREGGEQEEITRSTETASLREQGFCPVDTDVMDDGGKQTWRQM